MLKIDDVFCFFLQPGSRPLVSSLLEKYRAQLPAKPAAKSKAPSGGSNKPVAVRPAAYSDNNNKEEQPKVVTGRGKPGSKAAKGKVGLVIHCKVNETTCIVI